MPKQSTASNKPPLEQALKWVAAITAVLSLIFAVQKLMQSVAENNDRTRRIAELTQVAARQQQAGDYSLAWNSLSAATKLAESGGTFARMFGNLDRESTQLRVAREDIAMNWLANISVSGAQTFSDIVEQLMPALEQGVLVAAMPRKSDLLAHIGWGYFLRGRDGGKQVDPTPQYEQALSFDPLNPYAHAYWGHLLLWRDGKLAQAREHFEQALRSQRARERVRTMQLAAYRNRGADGDVAFVATVADMIKQGEQVDAGAQRAALWTLSRACQQAGTSELLQQLKREIQKIELVATYEALSTQAKDAVDQARQAKCSAALSLNLQ